MRPADAALLGPPHSKRLRTLLIIVTVIAGVCIVAAIPGVLFGTYMAAFAADDPSASTDAAWDLMLTVWGVGIGYVLLLAAGVIGGWIAYRKRRSRLSFGLSLLAAAPILLILIGILAVVLLNVLWTASL